MKNRPGVEKPNQYQDVYGSQSSSTRTTITVILTVLMTVFSIISLVKHSLLGVLFIPTLIVLIISLFVGRRADRYNMPVKPEDSPDAIFKEHEE